MSAQGEENMRSTPLAEARAELSRLVDRALKGEPQRVTRRGREAVVIVSEAEWGRTKSGKTEHISPPPTLGHLLANFANGVGFQEDDFVRTLTKTRPFETDPSD